MYNWKQWTSQGGLPGGRREDENKEEGQRVGGPARQSGLLGQEELPQMMAGLAVVQVGV